MFENSFILKSIYTWLFYIFFFCSATMFDIYINLLTQILNEVTYSAVMADYE